MTEPASDAKMRGIRHTLSSVRWPAGHSGRWRRRVESRFLASPPIDGVAVLIDGSRFPLDSERLALERLTLLDVEGAEAPLAEIARWLGRASRADLKAATLYGVDFLGAVNRLIWRGAAEERRRSANREALIASFEPISRAAGLRKAFEGSLSRILSPFHGARAGQHPAILRAKTFIRESYHRKISLREVAAHLGLSRTYLSTLFRKECGCTLTEYLHRVRLRRAEELIRNGAPALSEVASQVGYQNYRDFHRNFVRYQNASPLRFKRDLIFAAALPATPSEQV